MAFTEKLKLAVKRRAHFMCRLCHVLYVEVHHIIPEAQGGPDTEANAAPLCPSCHELYGTDPTKRRFIRQARDNWYEVCGKRYTADPDGLAGLAERLQHVATKDGRPYKSGHFCSCSQTSNSPSFGGWRSYPCLCRCSCWLTIRRLTRSMISGAPLS